MPRSDDASRRLALAVDYDGTIAEQGVVAGATRQALTRFKQTGRRLILITGRMLPDLHRVFDGVGMFDRVVTENGAVLYDPLTMVEESLAPPPAAYFVQALRERNVSPLAVGRAMVATWQPYETTVREVIRELGLDLQVILNKGAVMVLPSGVDKALGLGAALSALYLPASSVVGVGDAENDVGFMAACGYAAAVANALPMVRDVADIVLRGASGEGVVELIAMICHDDTPMVTP